jgi:hypothetical protein
VYIILITFKVVVAVYFTVCYSLLLYSQLELSDLCYEVTRYVDKK